MATQNVSSLKEAISQYETQLAQIRLAVSATTPGADRDNLIALQGDIEQLITLTNENLTSLEAKLQQEDEELFASEYAQFKAELARFEVSEAAEPAPQVDIQADLQELQGMKCQAPHAHQWGGSESFYNALVLSIESADDVTDMTQIQVRVMFINPTHQEMIPCPYFLEGECRFSEERCLFSHGERVSLTQLKEYREPDFTGLRAGSRVLVKQKDRMWHRAVVKTMIENRCTVKLESSRGQAEVELHDILPMRNDADADSSSDSSGDSSENEAELHESLVQRSLLVNPPSAALGGWEAHTKGFGSRIMASMGYVVGTGLGKCGEGRIEPVEAVVLPPGKSLDHCMALREQAGGDENLFKVERRMRRVHRKQQVKREKRVESEQQNQRTDVFSFINNTLAGKTVKPVKVDSPGSSLRAETSRGLNVVGFQLSEEIRRSERDLLKLQESLARHSQDSATHKTISGKLQLKQSELSQLRANEKNLDREKSQRKDMKKLAVF